MQKQISDLSCEELLEFIYYLNDNMKKYDANIERAMKRADRAEWDSLKCPRHQSCYVRRV